MIYWYVKCLIINSYSFNTILRIRINEIKRRVEISVFFFYKKKSLDEGEKILIEKKRVKGHLTIVHLIIKN